MGLFDKLRSELVDIVEWIDDDRRTLVWRFPRYQNEIKNGAKLIVRPGQTAVFVDQGKIADVFEAGSYDLATANLPIMTTLKGWKFGFNSPFKCEVYFVSTRQVTDLKWGTPNPVMLRDADFGMVRLRAFGTYGLKAKDPKILLKELVGTDGNFETEELGELMRSLIASCFADSLAELKMAALDLASHYRELGDALQKLVSSKIDDEYGLEIPLLSIVNISLPEEVEKALDTRASMGAIGDMQKYQQYQFANAIPAAAANTGGGLASAGLNLGVGMAMAQQFVSAGGAPNPTQSAQPPPLPAAGKSYFVALNGVQSGPFPLAQIQLMLAQGQVLPQTLVWSQGMPSWTMISQISDINLSQVPPPLP
jgi:membrane protease subunit (stomatin/prohibitin family)